MSLLAKKKTCIAGRKKKVADLQIWPAASHIGLRPAIGHEHLDIMVDPRENTELLSNKSETNACAERFSQKKLKTKISSALRARGDLIIWPAAGHRARTYRYHGREVRPKITKQK